MGLNVKSIYLTATSANDNDFDAKSDNTDVIVCLDTGEKYVASFFAYANIEELRSRHKTELIFLCGAYFWNRNMILIDECSRYKIESVIHDIIDEGNFKEAFRLL